ncbi:MAG: hypothetical protein FJ265_19935, partial [Planctomycetes bacterium]|nr:hypothetical protein [Planctomycetota bacterium]
MNGAAHDDGLSPAGPPREPDSRLADWVDGTLTARERERFVAELRVNPRLRQDLEDYERTVAAVRAALCAGTARVDLADRVLAAIASSAGTAPQPAPRRLGPWLWTLAAAAVLLGFAVWLDSFRVRKHGEDTVRTASVERQGEPAPEQAKAKASQGGGAGAAAAPAAPPPATAAAEQEGRPEVSFGTVPQKAEEQAEQPAKPGETQPARDAGQPGLTFGDLGVPPPGELKAEVPPPAAADRLAKAAVDPGRPPAADAKDRAEAVPPPAIVAGTPERAEPGRGADERAAVPAPSGGAPAAPAPTAPAPAPAGAAEVGAPSSPLRGLADGDKERRPSAPAAGAGGGPAGGPVGARRGRGGAAGGAAVAPLPMIVVTAGVGPTGEASKNLPDVAGQRGPDRTSGAGLPPVAEALERFCRAQFPALLPPAEADAARGAPRDRVAENLVALGMGRFAVPGIRLQFEELESTARPPAREGAAGPTAERTDAGEKPGAVSRPPGGGERRQADAPGVEPQRGPPSTEFAERTWLVEGEAADVAELVRHLAAL